MRVGFETQMKRKLYTNVDIDSMFDTITMPTLVWKKAGLYANLLCEITQRNLECSGSLLAPIPRCDGIATEVEYSTIQKSEHTRGDVFCYNPQVLLNDRHFKSIGMWHSHPNFFTEPSTIDYDTLQDYGTRASTFGKPNMFELYEQTRNTNAWVIEEEGQRILTLNDHHNTRITIPGLQLPEGQIHYKTDFSEGIGFYYSLVINKNSFKETDPVSEKDYHMCVALEDIVNRGTLLPFKNRFRTIRLVDMDVDCRIDEDEMVNTILDSTIVDGRHLSETIPKRHVVPKQYDKIQDSKEESALRPKGTQDQEERREDSIQEYQDTRIRPEDKQDRREDSIQEYQDRSIKPKSTQDQKDRSITPEEAIKEYEENTGIEQNVKETRNWNITRPEPPKLHYQQYQNIYNSIQKIPDEGDLRTHIPAIVSTLEKAVKKYGDSDLEQDVKRISFMEDTKMFKLRLSDIIRCLDDREYTNTLRQKIQESQAKPYEPEYDAAIPLCEHRTQDITQVDTSDSEECKTPVPESTYTDKNLPPYESSSDREQKEEDTSTGAILIAPHETYTDTEYEQPADIIPQMNGFLRNRRLYSQGLLQNLEEKVNRLSQITSNISSLYQQMDKIAQDIRSRQTYIRQTCEEVKDLQEYIKSKLYKEHSP
ncbi:MAG: hypothetical protein ACQESG_05570 [Nanobdellota archaeon]